MKKLLIVVDMQNDFITGALGSKDAEEIVDNVRKKVKSANNVIFTRDTHFDDYLQTQEGKNLPVEHCIKGTNGWQICDELLEFVKEGENVFDKVTFGCIEIGNIIKNIDDSFDVIELCGLCTDICVISNAMIIKAALPETKVVVDSSCCAGVTKQSHQTALDAMRAVQIEIV